jgi:endonuclease III
LINDAGLSRQKAPRIRAVLDTVARDFGSLSLEGLRVRSDADVEAYLTGLPGVGTKTAKCIMMYSLHRLVLPVDTHVWRLGRRLRLVAPELSYEKAQTALEQAVRPEDRFSFHVNGVAHGRAVCRAIRPRCEQCVLRARCPSSSTR